MGSSFARAQPVSLLHGARVVFSVEARWPALRGGARAGHERRPPAEQEPLLMPHPELLGKPVQEGGLCDCGILRHSSTAQLRARHLVFVLSPETVTRIPRTGSNGRTG